MINAHLHAALTYALQGWHVFPVAGRSKKPAIKDFNWRLGATTDEAQITQWWTDAPRANIGLSCSSSGLVAIDIDPCHGGDDSLGALVADLGALPATLTNRTSEGGRHYLYRLPSGDLRGQLGPGIDVRARAYIVVPPSVHPSGHVYTWEDPDAAVAALPAPWVARLRKPVVKRTTLAEIATETLNRYGADALRRETQKVAAAPEGERNITLNTAAYNLGQLVAGGELEQVLVMQALEQAAESAGLPDIEARKTIASGLTAGSAHPRRAPPLRISQAPSAPPEYLDAPPPDDADAPDDEEVPSWHADLVYKTDAKGNRKLARIPGNLAVYLTHEPVWAGVFGFDELSGQPRVMRAAPPLGGQVAPEAGEMRDDYAQYVQHWFARRLGVEWSIVDCERAIAAAAHCNSRHPVREYLLPLQWDGVERLPAWLQSYWGAAATEINAQIGTWWMISAVARVLKPGCQADYTLVLEGKQGVGKSSGLRLLCGDDWFQDKLGSITDKSAAESISGRWIVEIAELDAFRGVAAERIKGFLSATFDKYRPSYGRHTVTYYRQCVFAGTTNESGYLRDATGGRRFWPVHVTCCDRAGLERDRDQLWAEAVVRYQRGEPWWPQTAEQVEQLADVQEQRYEGDAWEEAITAWLQRQMMSEVSAHEILTGALGVDDGRIDQACQRRVGQIMPRLGWPRKRRRRDGRHVWVYVRE